MVKDARVSYFANLISSSKRNPEILFDTINNIVTPAPPDVPVFLNKDCSNFVSFFAVVAKQLTSVLTAHNILHKFQSGFHQKHSTETVLLRVSNDIMMSSDLCECSVLVLLDFSTAFDTSKVAHSTGSFSSAVQSNLRNLCVIFDQAMYFNQHVKSLTRTCFFHLRNTAKLRSVVSQPEQELAFISSRLDYCSSLFTCLSKSSLHCLQMVQYTAERLLTRSSQMTHITPILFSLHWFSIKFRIYFKVLVFTYRTLHGQAPAYISDLLHPYITYRSLTRAYWLSLVLD